MRIIELEKHIKEWLDEIEVTKEKSEQYCEEQHLSFDTVIKLSKFESLVMMMKAMGVKYKKHDIDADKGLYLWLILPSETELCYINSDGKIIYLDGKNIAKAIKGAIAKAMGSLAAFEFIENIFTDHVTIKYKIYDTYVSYDDYITAIKDVNKCKEVVDRENIQNSIKEIKETSAEHKRDLISSIETFSLLQRYGIDFNAQSLITYTNSYNTTGVKPKLIINVPERSKFSYDNVEIAGEYAFSFAKDIIYKNIHSSEIVDFSCNIINDLIWDWDKYLDKELKIRSSIDAIKTMIF